MSYDIVIAGGGLAGASLAIAGAGHGLSVALVEAGPVDTFSSTEPERVIALSWGSRCCMERLGVWGAIAGLGAAPIRQVHVHEPGNRGVVCMHQAEAGVEALGYVVQNACLLRALYEGMPETVKVIASTRVQSLEWSGDALQVVAVKGGRTTRLSCRLLAAADGTNSRIRQLCGIESRGWDHNRFGLVASVRTERPHRGIAYECFRSAGPLAFLPLDDSRCSIVWTLPPRDASRIVGMDDAGFLRALGKAAGRKMLERLGGFVGTGPRACFPFEYRMALSLTTSRVALIGNAAHTLHPVAGQGLNLGLRDVTTLADALGRARASGRDIGAPVLLEEYRQKRLPDNLAVSLFTEGLNAVFSNDFTPLKLARGSGLAVMNRLPPLKTWLMRRTTGLTRRVTPDGDKVDKK